MSPPSSTVWSRSHVDTHTKWGLTQPTLDIGGTKHPLVDVKPHTNRDRSMRWCSSQSSITRVPWYPHCHSKHHGSAFFQHRGPSTYPYQHPWTRGQVHITRFTSRGWSALDARRVLGASYYLQGFCSLASLSLDISLWILSYPVIAILGVVDDDTIGPSTLRIPVDMCQCQSLASASRFGLHHSLKAICTCI